MNNGDGSGDEMTDDAAGTGISLHSVNDAMQNHAYRKRGLTAKAAVTRFLPA
jgi:hypothetical protein